VSTNFRAIPDFDLFLVNLTKGHVYFSSQSFEDNNEGFDVDVGAWPGNEEGDVFEIRLGWLPGFLDECFDSNGFERLAWVYWIWPEGGP
jgi:hypothetical protein